MHLLANGYWECTVCQGPTGERDEPLSRCVNHAAADVKFVKPQPVTQIWLSKNLMGYADKSFLETKWKGDLTVIPDEDLMKLYHQAMEVLGKPQLEREREEASDGE
jgi:hypothetical protein